MHRTRSFIPAACILFVGLFSVDGLCAQDLSGIFAPAPVA